MDKFMSSSQRKMVKSELQSLRKALLSVCLLLTSLGLHAQNASLDDQKLIIENIRCEGNEYTRCDFIRGKYYQKVGDIADAKKITNARLRLNTTSQFYYARARLEKGSQKGQVIVVFTVVEAPRISYGLSAFARGGEGKREDSFVNFRSSSQELSIGGLVVNNNFLGRAKQLTFSVDESRSESKLDSESEYTDLISGQPGGLINSVDSQGQSTSLSLGYLDPYLFGSSRYFMSLNFFYSRSKNVTTGFFIDKLNDAVKVPVDNRNEGEGIFFTSSLGRNIGRFSYLDVSYAADDGNFESFSFGYGWNRENNLIFSTSGDLLDLRFTRRDLLDQVNTNYAKNFSVSEKQVVTLSGRLGAVRLNSATDFENYSYGIDVRFERALTLALGEGRFSSWYAGIQLGGTSGDFSSDMESIGFSAGYTRLINGVNIGLGVSYSTGADLL